jgi:Holliday junction DNA helicase RuvA
VIAKLTGRVEAIESDRCVIDVNGVGYLVQASTRTLALLAAGASVSLLIEMLVREDAILLFGFADAAEREWFRLLTTVQGVGAKVALSLLSALSPPELIGAIQAGDRASLTRVSGVGTKLAARLLTELHDKAAAMPAGVGAGGAFGPAAVAPGAAGDAVSVLVNLGYRRAEALAAVGRAAERLGEGAAIEALIREGLKELAR